MKTIPFADVPINGKFYELPDMDRAIKTSETTAVTEYCARGFCVGMRPDEMVAIREEHRA